MIHVKLSVWKNSFFSFSKSETLRLWNKYINKYEPVSLFRSIQRHQCPPYFWLSRYTNNSTFTWLCLYSTTSNYKLFCERFILDLKSISKSDFHHVCHILCPENAISLILSNDDETPGQIELFFSCIDIHQFIRLRSIAVFLTDDDNLDRILSFWYQLNDRVLRIIEVQH